ncbi:transmembrane signal receptor [Lithospermum erythrorhizon]|uniref:Transmembrane signal receptor n=1 Tax=Lithospermum erythrorhizon TaxID=34254 RepID=A0AAV3NUA4_LITER
MHFSMVICMKKFICNLLKVSMLQLARCVGSGSHCMVSNRLADNDFPNSAMNFSNFVILNPRMIILYTPFMTRKGLSLLQFMYMTYWSLVLINDLGRLHYFLGFEILPVDGSLFMTQSKFAHELLVDSGLTFPGNKAKGYPIPLPLNLKLLPDEGDLLQDAEYYRSMVGKLNFLTNTRPYLSFFVQVLSQFVQAPRQYHLQALIHLLNYVFNTTTQGIIVHGSKHLELQAFSDSDWTSYPTTRSSLTGYIVTLGGSSISWKSKKQNIISKSSGEAEYRALAQAVAELTWLVRLLTDLGVQDLSPVTLHCDNNSALHIARNPVFHERSKYIDIDCHFTRDQVLEGLLHLVHLPTLEQVANILTKVLPSPQHNYLLSKFGVLPPRPPSLRGGC